MRRAPASCGVCVVCGIAHRLLPDEGGPGVRAILWRAGLRQVHDSTFALLRVPTPQKHIIHSFIYLLMVWATSANRASALRFATCLLNMEDVGITSTPISRFVNFKQFYFDMLPHLKELEKQNLVTSLLAARTIKKVRPPSTSRFDALTNHSPLSFYSRACVGACRSSRSAPSSRSSCPTSCPTSPTPRRRPSPRSSSTRPSSSSVRTSSFFNARHDTTRHDQQHDTHMARNTHAHRNAVHNTMDIAALDMRRRCNCTVATSYPSAPNKVGLAASCTGCI